MVLMICDLSATSGHAYLCSKQSGVDKPALVCLGSQIYSHYYILYAFAGVHMLCLDLDP